MATSFAIIEAPSNLGLQPGGVETLPEALLAHGLEQRLSARRLGRVEAPPRENGRGETGILNASSIASYARLLADAIHGALDDGDFPVVLGGDCSILLGSTLALRRRGRHGLLFLDGHTDFYQPEAEPNGEAASMDLALATGHGPSELADLEQLGPLVRADDVVIFGARDAAESAEFGMQALPAELRVVYLAEVREAGAEHAAGEALGHLTRNDELAGFWIHLDVDVLDDAVMPAVDYRMPDGLSWDELTTVLHAAMKTQRAVGLEVTIFNPRLDPTGDIASSLVDHLVEGLRGNARLRQTIP